MGPLTYEDKPGRASNSEWRDEAKFGVKKTTAVSLHTLNTKFCMNHTNGTGMSVALNMQTPSRQGGPVANLNAKVMISHSWSEDMEEVLDMLKEFEGTLLRTSEDENAPMTQRFDDNTPIWFCALSQFQVNTSQTPRKDPLGPTVGEQVAQDPFEKVINDTGVLNMIVLQTSTADPYTRYDYYLHWTFGIIVQRFLFSWFQI